MESRMCLLNLQTELGMGSRALKSWIRIKTNSGDGPNGLNKMWCSSGRRNVEVTFRWEQSIAWKQNKKVQAMSHGKTWWAARATWTLKLVLQFQFFSLKRNRSLWEGAGSFSWVSCEVSSHECSKGPLHSSSGIFPSREVLPHLFAGGGTPGFPCHVLVKSPGLANYSSESVSG